MRLNLTGESSVEAWFWRLLLGPATVLDGVVATLTGGSLLLGAGFAVTKRLARDRAMRALFF